MKKYNTIKKLTYGVIRFIFVMSLLTGLLPAFILGNIFQILGVWTNGKNNRVTNQK